jgi:deoxyribodipyrimidine photo-lyase
MTEAPILYWVRRDLRLTDNAALCAAAARGSVIPVFIVDEVVETHGAAPRWRLGLGVEAFAKALSVAGSGLVVRRGRALDVLRDLWRRPARAKSIGTGFTIRPPGRGTKV